MWHIHECSTKVLETRQITLGILVFSRLSLIDIRPALFRYLSGRLRRAGRPSRACVLDRPGMPVLCAALDQALAAVASSPKDTVKVFSMH